MEYGGASCIALCASLLELKEELMPSDQEFTTMETYITIMKPLVE